MKGLLGIKLGMTRIMQEDGKVVPITVVKCENNVVTEVKNDKKNGYSAIVLGSLPYHKQTKTKKFKHVKEFRLPEDNTEIKKGDILDINLFQEGDRINIQGTSKGKGFQGVMKRWGMKGGPKSHGSHFKREPGSVGACASPGKIWKGQKLPGRMGNDTVTTRTSIVYIDKEKGLLGIKGAVPGGNKSLVKIKKI